MLNTHFLYSSGIHTFVCSTPFSPKRNYARFHINAPISFVHSSLWLHIKTSARSVQQQNVSSPDVSAASGVSNIERRPTTLHGCPQSTRCNAPRARVTIAWPLSHSPRKYQVPPHRQLLTPLSRAAARSKSVGAQRTCAVKRRQMQNLRLAGLKPSANPQTTALCNSLLLHHLRL